MTTIQFIYWELIVRLLQENGACFRLKSESTGEEYEYRILRTKKRNVWLWLQVKTSSGKYVFAAGVNHNDRIFKCIPKWVNAPNECYNSDIPKSIKYAITFIQKLWPEMHNGRLPEDVNFYYVSEDEHMSLFQYILNLTKAGMKLDIIHNTGTDHQGGPSKWFIR